MTAEKFEAALSELIGMSMDAGLHLSEMVGPLEAELRWCREQLAEIDKDASVSGVTE